jgi:hypothetical protein
MHNYNFVGAKTWSLTLGKECRLMVFENRVLRKIIGTKRGEVTTYRRVENAT